MRAPRRAAGAAPAPPRRVCARAPPGARPPAGARRRGRAAGRGFDVAVPARLQLGERDQLAGTPARGEARRGGSSGRRGSGITGQPAVGAEPGGGRAPSR